MSLHALWGEAVSRSTLQEEAIILRQEMDFATGRPRCYLIGDWPERTRITAELLDASPMIATQENGDVIITVDNGFATYRKCAIQQSNDYVSLELCSGAFSPAPLLKRVR